MSYNCLICDSKKVKALRDIILCKSCWFYQKKHISKSYDIAPHYNSYTYEKHKVIYESQRDIYRFIKNNLISFFKINFNKYSVLEIGFGHGGLLNELKRLGFNVYGVDISESAYKYAVLNGIDSKNLYIGDFLDVDFKDVFFDVVIMNGVIEEFYDPVVVMKKISSITKKDSILIIRTKNSLFHIFASYCLSPFINSAGVLISCGFSFKALNILLEKYGFKKLSYSFVLTRGDPYSQFSLKFIVHITKFFLMIISYIIFYLSFKKFVISPSFIIISKKV